MKINSFWNWASLLMFAATISACGVDIPKETESSYETMTVNKSDLETQIKFSAKMKGQSDVTITPQVSGQLMKICVTEGQTVRKGQTLFIIDSRNAQLNEAINMYNGAIGIIALYIALGGATK
ncbi:MAG: biotin/lipoyl-binding protein [Muribaculaceae bacterium]|nr:biotin/lipoyl-binding protein [Muribaculaceae bacterium]